MRFKLTELFAIDCSEQFALEKHSLFLLYSPMKEELALIDNDTLNWLLRYSETKDPSCPDEIKDLFYSFHYPQVTKIPVRDVKLSERLSIIPNLTCNFACSYCYSASGRSGTVLEWGKAKTALDFFIDSQRINNQYLSLFITGGGEPLVTWPQTKRIIEYARKKSIEQGLDLNISMITNGSLITSDIADVIRENDCIVGVSFEVLEDLQNHQRKMWAEVSQNIRLLHEHGVTVKINSTITPSSVSRMEEMLQTVIRDFPFAAEYTMEPVTSVDLFGSASLMGKFYNNYFNSYIKCAKLAKENQLNLRFTFDDAMRGITPRHCPGKFCITPTGKISVCHLVSSPKEKRFCDCVYGEVTNDGVFIDSEKFKTLYNINVTAYDRCRDCFAKWDCGGECMTRNAIYPDAYLNEVCKFNRKFICHALLEKVAETIRNEYGMTIEEYVRS